MGADQTWNLNIHYDALLDRHVPTTARDVLDVGCGDGFLAARLATRIPAVTAIDTDAPVLARARQRFPVADVRWRHGDVLSTELPMFDAVVSNAALHHLGDTRGALRRLSALVRPGGTLAIVTFVKPSLRQVHWHLASTINCAVANRLKGKWEHSAPIVWPPPDTLSQLRAHTQPELTGARVRRLAYGRVLLTWRAPGQV
jgi:2-polyprenyl-3-methyl-5-hydroxy-6-metoxy-1,4-benzoquinol methylase